MKEEDIIELIINKYFVYQNNYKYYTTLIFLEYLHTFIYLKIITKIKNVSAATCTQAILQLAREPFTLYSKLPDVCFIINHYKKVNIFLYNTYYLRN